MRALGRALAGLVAFAAVAIAGVYLYLVGSNIYDYFTNGPWTPTDQAQAAVAKLAGETLYPSSLRDIRELLGEPEHIEHSSSEINVDVYRWYRGAVRVRAVGDVPIRIELGHSSWFDLLPLGRPDFPGKFLDLKIGEPVPSPEAGEAIRWHALRCCEAMLLLWGQSGGRVSWIDFQRNVRRLPGY